MHVILNREELIKPLGYVAGVVERRQTLPVLAFMLLRCDGNIVSMTGTDLEVEISVKSSGTVKESGSTLVPARKLLDICRALPPEASIELRADGAKVSVKSGRSRFTLITLPTGDFPTVGGGDTETTFQIPQASLRKLLEETHFCMAQQDVRYYLNGVLLEITGKTLRSVATDGHRMAVSNITHSATPNTQTIQAIVPRKAVQELLRLLDNDNGDVTVELSKNSLRATTTNITFTSKLIDGRYPDYQKVLPLNQDKKIEVGREEFKESLSRVAILANEKYRGVRLALDKNLLRMSANNPEQEEAQEELAISYTGGEVEIGFNVGYLLDALNAIRSDRVIIELSDANSSCLLHALTDPSAQYVIMPMRL